MKIIANLEGQNGRLQEEVEVLSGKVRELVEARKLPKQSRNNPQVEQEVARVKNELEMKYESMRFLKEQIGRAKQSEMTEDMRMKVQEQGNIIQKCQR